MKKNKHVVSSKQLEKASYKSYERDMEWLEEILKDTKIMITDKEGKTFLIDQGNIKPIDP